MFLRRFLLLVPAALLLLLLQAAIWVPRYGHNQQASRLKTFIESSSGDARTLNPVLHADTSSGRIVDLVFDGLLKVGNDLKLHGALATSWELREEAFLRIEADLTEGADAANNVLARLRKGLAKPEHRALANKIDALALTQANASIPQRIKFSLNHVVPDLLDSILLILGKQYGHGDTNRATNRATLATNEHVGTQENRQANNVPLLEHNPIIRFNLRKSVQFHDGIPFKADDVLFTYNTIMAPLNRSPLRSSFEPVKAIRIIDPHTLDVTYKRLFSSALNAWTVGIVPDGLHSGTAFNALRRSDFNRHPIGTGAFRFSQWQSSEFIKLEKNLNYWDSVPLIETYYYRIIPDQLTKELEFRSGVVDTFQVEPHQARRYRADKRYQSFSILSNGYTYIGYNQRKSIFANADMRRALGMAIDTRAIIQYVLFGEGQRTTGPFPRNSPWYDKHIPALAYDPLAAQKLLNQLGWHKNQQGWLERNGKVLEFNLITNNGNLRRKAIASIVQRYWQRMGIKSHIQLFEWSVFLKDFINPGKFDAVILGWQLELDPDQYQIWHSSQTGPNQLNFIGFKNRQADILMEQIRREYDDNKQIELAHKLHRIIAKLQPYTFLFAPQGTQLLDKRIVMHNSSNQIVPVRPGGAGNLFYYMNRWQKIAHSPDF